MPAIRLPGDVAEPGPYRLADAGQYKDDGTVYAAIDLIRVQAVFLSIPDHLPEARQTAAAHGYWNDEPAHYLDIVFFGWLFDEGRAFYDSDICQYYVDEVRDISKWRPER